MMNKIFKRAIDFKHLRYMISSTDDVLEKWVYSITCASLEKPLLTTFVTLTTGAIILTLFFILLAVFAGVICITCMILLIEGLALIMILVIFGMLITICSYIYVAGLSVNVCFKEKQYLDDYKPYATAINKEKIK